MTYLCHTHHGGDFKTKFFVSLFLGTPFLKGTKMESEMKNPGVMMLISLGNSVAYFYSLYAFVANNLLLSSVHIMDFFWELVTLILIMLLGHWIEMNAISKAGNTLQKMAGSRLQCCSYQRYDIKN